jgi:mannitol-1-phosphate 5-dehydrogenase
MVPIMSEKEVQEDVLKVYAEPYNTLILDKKGFRNVLPEVKGLAPKENMKAWVDRKSFIHNLGHASAAYYGYFLHPEATFMWEVLADSKIYTFTRDTMQQSAKALMAEYPDEFTIQDSNAHIEDLILRFQNKSLGDTVFRVGLDLYRKLGPQDRLVGAIRMAIKHGLPYNYVLKAILYGFRFKATDEFGHMYPADDQFHMKAKKLDINRLLEQICGFDKNKDAAVFELIEILNK